MSCQHGNPFGECDLCDELLAEYRSGIETGRKQMEQERDSLLADNARLREALAEFLRNPGGDYTEEVAEEALTATPAQSLARHDNAIREGCAQVCDRLALSDRADDRFSRAIRAMKEPE